MGKMENMSRDQIGSGLEQQSEQLQTSCEQILKSEQVQIDRKTLVLTLKKNQRGDYLRISEKAGSHNNTIIFPAAGIQKLIKVLGEMAKRVDS